MDILGSGWLIVVIFVFAIPVVFIFRYLNKGQIEGLPPESTEPVPAKYKVALIHLPKESKQHDDFLHLPQNVMSFKGVESAQLRYGKEDELEVHFRDEVISADQLVAKIKALGFSSKRISVEKGV